MSETETGYQERHEATVAALAAARAEVVGATSLLSASQNREARLGAEVARLREAVEAVRQMYCPLCGSQPAGDPSVECAWCDSFRAALAPVVPSGEAESGDDYERGLYGKYRVERISDPTGKHADCRYFVLDPQHDPHAVTALRAYADACAAEYPALAADLRAWAAPAAVSSGGHKFTGRGQCAECGTGYFACNGPHCCEACREAAGRTHNRISSGGQADGERFTLDDAAGFVADAGPATVLAGGQR